MSQLSEFSTIGQLRGFVIKDGYKLKYLRVAIADQEYWFKPAKNIRDDLSLKLTPNCWLEITGEKKICQKTGKLKLKANAIQQLTIQPSSADISPPQIQEIKPKPKACILVCKKSNCWKRGGEAICHQLETSLEQRGLAGEVQIKTTGCLKQCKQGPNLVMMPDKTRYSHVKPQEVIDLLDEHFPEPIVNSNSPTMASIHR